MIERKNITGVRHVQNISGFVILFPSVLACSSFKGSPSTGFNGIPHINGSADDFVVVVVFFPIARVALTVGFVLRLRNLCPFKIWLPYRDISDISVKN